MSIERPLRILQLIANCSDCEREEFCTILERKAKLNRFNIQMDIAVKGKCPRFLNKHLPKISKVEAEILKWHHAGKRHSWIENHYDITMPKLHDLILETARGYRVE